MPKIQTSITLKVKYKIGQQLKILDRIYTVIGYEYVESRALRYILLHGDMGVNKWEYMYDFEVQTLLSKD